MRLLVLGVISFAVVFSLVPQMGGAIILGNHKAGLERAYGDAGLDVSDCKAHPRSMYDPGGGMPGCLEPTFKDASRKLSGNSAQAGEVDAPVGEPDLE